MKTIKMTIAAVLAATMGTAMASSIDGLDSNFQYYKPGSTDNTTHAVITQVNDILAAVHATSGSKIDDDAFWRTFIEPKETKIFNYTVAEKFLKELVYTVDGKSLRTLNDGSTEWRVDTNDYSTDASVLGGTTLIENGQLRAKGEAAMTLLGSLGFDTSGAGTFGAVNADTSNAVGATIELSTDYVAIALTSGTNVAQKVLDANVSGVTNGSINSQVLAAKVDPDAFNNANALIAKIAEQLKTGYVLNVGQATSALAGVINQHNGFLGASVLSEAKKLKDIIKVIAYQSAASTLAQVTMTTCSADGEGTSGTACVKIGEKFRDISSKVNDANVDLSQYNLALIAIDAFATNIINFNTGTGNAGTFDAAIAASTVATDLGIITVAGDGNTPPAPLLDIASVSDWTLIDYVVTQDDIDAANSIYTQEQLNTTVKVQEGLFTLEGFDSGFDAVIFELDNSGNMVAGTSSGNLR